MPLDHEFGLDRRTFLGAGLAAGVASVLPFARPARGAGLMPLERSDSAGAARNLIFLVSDGMSFGTLTLAEMWRRRRDQRSSNWVSLWNRPGVRRASATTFSADALVTDSAAGGSAWGCGVHINNGAVNVSPDGSQHLPLLCRAGQAGKKTGVVTTTTVTHATPASFLANVPTREMQPAIAEQMLERGIDVMMGGGARYFSAKLLDSNSSVVVARDAAQLRGAHADPATGRLLGLFAEKHVPFVLDTSPLVPTLAEMSKIAIERLSKGNNGFVLQIEGGRVDHAAHSNDAPSLLAEQLAFDDALGEVIRFTQGRDDTLVIITTDHGNANPGLTLYAKAGNDAFDNLPKAKRSFEWIDSELVKITDPQLRIAKAPDIIEFATGSPLSETERSIYADSLRAKRVMPFAHANNSDSVLGALLASRFGVAFLSPNHTSDMVEVTAWGPGSERLKPQIDNIDLHTLAVDSLGLGEGKPLPGMDQKLKVKPPAKDD